MYENEADRTAEERAARKESVEREAVSANATKRRSKIESLYLARESTPFSVDEYARHVI